MSGKAFAALVSGVNVGGRSLKMAELRDLLGQLGYADVATYVQSGNAVFRADGANAAGIAADIEAAVEQRFGFRSRVMVRDAAWFAGVVDGNPYPEVASDHTKLHAYTMEGKPSDAAVRLLSERDAGAARWEIRGDVLYLHAPDGIGRLKFAEQIARTLKVPVTQRNWRTILELRKMMGALET